MSASKRQILTSAEIAEPFAGSLRNKLLPFFRSVSAPTTVANTGGEEDN